MVGHQPPLTRREREPADTAAKTTAAESSSSSTSSSPSSCSSGWTFHHLPRRPSREDEPQTGVDDDDDDANTEAVATDRSLNGHGDRCGFESEWYCDDDVPPTLARLVNEFDGDGFLCLSGVLKPGPGRTKCRDDEDHDDDEDVVGTLRDLVMRHISDVFLRLHENGHSSFPLSHRRRRVIGCEGAGALGATTNEGRAVRSVNGEGDGNGEGEQGRSAVTVSGCGRYEYPMRCGVKNGFREVVMRSPGRYELAILNNNHAGGGGSGDVVGETPTSSSPSSPSLLMDQVRRHVLSNDDLLHLVRSLLVRHGPDGRQNSSTATSTAPTGRGDTDATGNDEVDDDGVCAKNDKCSAQGEEGEDDDDEEGYRLLSVSIVVSAPGADDQGWHADGGHVNPAKHETCHCLNVFLPLAADAKDDEEELRRLGPTELRPGTHYHTRNLAPMMLAARARRSLRPPALPLVGAGDALIFDYRVLHRGRANATGVRDGGGDEVDGCGDGDVDGGRCRPVLVLTFSQSWFRDVLNFPRRSLLAPPARSPAPPTTSARCRR